MRNGQRRDQSPAQILQRLSPAIPRVRRNPVGLAPLRAPDGPDEGDLAAEEQEIPRKVLRGQGRLLRGGNRQVSLLGKSYRD